MLTVVSDDTDIENRIKNLIYHKGLGPAHIRSLHASNWITEKAQFINIVG